jgi:hypothetical protein
MRDYLLDLVQHTHGIGVIELIKITGDESKTYIQAVDKKTRTVMVNAEFKKQIPEFIGTFGMPNLDRLNIILNIPEYKDGAEITVSHKKDDAGVDVPVSIDFKNKTGDFKNSYRLMGSSVINDQIRNSSMRQVKWNVNVVPSAQAIQKLKFQSQAHSDVTNFSTKTEDGNLNIYFGDHSSHAGHFTFATNCGGNLQRPLLWPVSVVLNILNLPGEKTFKISDEGAAEISVDSGIAIYHYQLPSRQK